MPAIEPRRSTSQTINLDQLKMSVYKYEGNPVGQIGLYTAG